MYIQVTTFKESGKYYDEWQIDVPTRFSWNEVIEYVRHIKNEGHSQSDLDWLIGMDSNETYDCYPMIIKGQE